MNKITTVNWNSNYYFFDVRDVRCSRFYDVVGFFFLDDVVVAVYSLTAAIATVLFASDSLGR
jgi:hypothetical protein